MFNPDDYRFLLIDSIERLRSKADSNHGEDLYSQGRQMAYYEILNEILINADAVGLTPKDVGMEGFDPESLLSTRKAA